MIFYRKREAAPCSLNGAVTASLKLDQNYKMTQLSLQTLNTYSKNYRIKTAIFNCNFIKSMKRVLPILFISLLIACTHNIDITGKWKCIGWYDNIGDLTLSKDSTFLLTGDHRLANDTIRVRRNDDRTGTWQIENKKILILNLNLKEKQRYWVRFKIVTLDKNNLVLVSA